MEQIYNFEITDEMFYQVRADLDEAINQTLDKMREKEVNEGEIALSLKIHLNDETIITEDGEGGEVFVPLITHKVTTKLTMKSDTTGLINGYADRDNVLAVDKLDGKYIARLVPKDGTQISF